MIDIGKDELYPLLFTPIYKEVFWGGKNFARLLNRTLPSSGGPFGEAWDLCDFPGMSSTIRDGALAGVQLHELVETFGREFVGMSFRGTRFPLTVKLTDTGKRMSLHVHPDEQTACQLGGGCSAKSEMWYVLSADKNAKLYAGLKTSTTRQQFLDCLNSPDVENLLQSFDSIPGDAYFINAGRVHFAGEGNLLLEIGQCSPTSFRLYDWGRGMENGAVRKLDLDLAERSIDYMDRTVPRICGASNTTRHNRKYPLINQCPYFRTDDLRLIESWRDSTEESDSFHILTAADESFTVENRKDEVIVNRGESVLLPACYGNYWIHVEPGKTTTVVRTTL